MSSAGIYFHHQDPVPRLATSDAGTVEALAAALKASLPTNYIGPPTGRYLVPVRDLEIVLHDVGRHLWAPVLRQFEDAHMVLVKIDH
jgi:hypothetical protein